MSHSEPLTDAEIGANVRRHIRVTADAIKSMMPDATGNPSSLTDRTIDRMLVSLSVLCEVAGTTVPEAIGTDSAREG